MCEKCGKELVEELESILLEGEPTDIGRKITIARIKAELIKFKEDNNGEKS